MSILVCTLGTTWQVVPEILGVLDPERCPLYALAPERAAAVRHEACLPAPTEIWVVTTAGTTGDGDLRAWWQRLGHPGRLRLWRTAATDGAAQAEVELIRELIHRAVLGAGPDALLCLSGGRKTMSADLQRAGMAYGCRAMLHVLPPEARDLQQRLNAQDFATPLPADLAAAIQPVLVGRSRRGDLLDLAPSLDAKRFPLPPEDAPVPVLAPSLHQTLAARETEGGNLLVQYHAEVARSEHHENWRCLYRLPPHRIEALRHAELGPDDRAWLAALPKADLHCHLGGILDLDEQIEVGAAVWETLHHHERQLAEADAKAWLDRSDVAGGDRWRFTDRERRARAAAALLAQTDRTTLAAALWPPGPRLALTTRHAWGFTAYEHPGSLVGSTILHTPAATWAMATAIRDRCRRDGLAYLELRCSPQKYYHGFLDDLHLALTRDHEPGDPLIRVIVIADRRNVDSIAATVRLALDARQRLDGFVVGLDVAGDEAVGDPNVLAPAFADAFAECLPITIHAGEGQPAVNIWKSAYHLHADRIGHGLTLAQAPELAQRFRDRRTALELCPTSNREVVGFHDPDHPGCDTPYPLRNLMALGVPLTLCTDNPGISRTTLADEYVTAGRLAALTRWEALALIKQGFLHAFLPTAARETLIKTVDQQIATALKDLP